jgi:stage II sporulation protein D
MPRICLLPHRIALTVTAVAISVGFAIPSPASAATTFSIKGGGYGHGIGLSQWGARGYALQGKKYDWILAHYYQDTKLVTKPSETVRVNLDRRYGESGYVPQSRWQIRSGTEASLTISSASTPTQTVSVGDDDIVWVVYSSGDVRVCEDETYKDGSTTKHRAGDTIATLEGESIARASGRVQIVGSSGPFGHSGIRWRGTVHFRPGSGGLHAINYVDLEDYLYGVVPRESPSSWPAEALKAQAVAARSYAYQDAKAHNTLKCTTRSQVYGGHSRPGHTHEAASANSAVDATKGQLVWYGSQTQPVKTYFSSSSGGHTASIEDVWTGGSPKPYYKGVEDADQASPAYRWNLGPYTATEFAAKLRAAGVSSAPAPATVTAVKSDRATSGHTRSVTFTWSNGASTTVGGNTLRSKLGLKSTNFEVVSSKPPIDDKYDDDDAMLTWVGPWSIDESTSYSGDSAHESSTKGSKLIVTFSGTAVRIIGDKSASGGKATVHIDGKNVGTIDTYAAKTDHIATLMTRESLKSGTHTLVLEVTGTHASASDGATIRIDRIDLAGTLKDSPAQTQSVEQTSKLVTWTGTWKKWVLPTLSGGSQAYTSQAKASSRIRFYGTKVTWVGSKGPNYGTALVSVDGSSPTTVTMTASKVSRKVTLFTSKSLDRTKVHTLVITAKGAGSGGKKGMCSVDRFDITNGWMLDPK